MNSYVIEGLLQMVTGGSRRIENLKPHLGVVSEDRGSALVEIAVAMPIICAIMTGIFSFSIATFQKMQLTEAVAVGGRFLAVDRGDTDPCATTAAKVYAAAPTLSKTKMTLTFMLNGTSYSNATCSGTTNMVSGGTAQIQATYPCSFVVYGSIFGTCTLHNTVTEAIQ